MQNGRFDLQTTCAYCLRRVGEEIEYVLPVNDWNSGKLLGYFCPDHYMTVKAKNVNSCHFGLDDFERKDLFA